MGDMEIPDELIDQLLGEYEGPEQLTGPDGLINRLRKRLIERAAGAELGVGFANSIFPANCTIWYCRLSLRTYGRQPLINEPPEPRQRRSLVTGYVGLCEQLAEHERVSER